MSFLKIILLLSVLMIIQSCSDVPDRKTAAAVDIQFTKMLSEGKYTEIEQTNSFVREAGETAISESSPTSAELVPQNGHRQRILTLAYARNGKFYMTGSFDNALKLWRPDGVLIRTIPTEANVTYVTTTPDDRFLLVGQTYGRLYLMDLYGHVLKKYNIGNRDVNKIDISPDGQKILAGMGRGSRGIFVFDISGRQLAAIKTERDGIEVNGLKFINNREFINIENQNISFWDISGKLIKTLKSSNRFLSALDINADKTIFVTTGYSYTKKYEASYITEVWNTEGNLLYQYSVQPSRSVTFTPDGQQIINLGEKTGYIKIHSLNGKVTNSFKIGRSNPSAYYVHLALAPDLSRIITPDNARFPIKVNQFRFDGSKIQTAGWDSFSGNDVDFAPDGKTFATVTTGYKVQLWSITGKLLKTLNQHKHIVYTVQFSPNGKYFATGSADDQVILWDKQGNKIKSFKHEWSVSALTFSPDSNYLITGDGKGFIRVINLKDFSIIKFRADKKDSKQYYNKRINSIAVHPYKKIIAAGSFGDPIRIWSFSGKLLHARYYKDYNNDRKLYRAVSLAYTPDGKQLAVKSGYNVVTHAPQTEGVQFYDEMAKYLSGLPAAPSGSEGEIIFSKSGKWFAATNSNDIYIWESASKKLVKILRGHTYTVTGIAFSPDDKFLVSTANDARTKIWNLERDTNISLLSGEGEWLMYSDDGFFDGSRYGGKLLAMVKGIDAFSIDQFALTYNRPDLIYKNIGIGDLNFVNHFYLQYEKRLKRKGTTSLQKTILSTPEVELYNVKTQGKITTFSAKLKDSLNELSHYQVYVNNVPIYRGLGKSIEGNNIVVNEKIELGKGKNKIEIGARNIFGGESLKATTYENYHGRIKPELYYLGFGVSRYQNPEFNLGYAHKDILDIGKQFAGLRKEYQAVHVKTFIDNQVTPDTIKQARAFLQQTQVDDVVVLFIAGHGVYDFTDKATYYFMTHNAELKNLANTAINFDELESLLTDIKARNKLFLIDTCESGEIEDDSVASYTSIAKKSRFIARNIKTKSRALRQSRKRSYLYDKDRYIYNNLQRRTGAIVFSSSRGGELSYESDEYKNGFFSEKVLQALSTSSADKNRDGRVDTHELQDYVSKSVAKVSKNLQHPTVDRDNIYQQFSFPIAR